MGLCRAATWNLCLLQHGFIKFTPWRPNKGDIGLCWFCITSAEAQLGLPRAKISSDAVLGHLGPSETFPGLQG